MTFWWGGFQVAKGFLYAMEACEGRYAFPEMATIEHVGKTPGLYIVLDQWMCLVLTDVQVNMMDRHLAVTLGEEFCSVARTVGHHIISSCFRQISCAAYTHNQCDKMVMQGLWRRLSPTCCCTSRSSSCSATARSRGSSFSGTTSCYRESTIFSCPSHHKDM